MSQHLLRCRNPVCPAPHGAILGRLTADGGLVLDSAVMAFRVFLDTRRAVLVCPACLSSRDFRGNAIFASEIRSGH